MFRYIPFLIIIMIMVTYHDDDEKWDVAELLLLKGANADVKDKVSIVQRIKLTSISLIV